MGYYTDKNILIIGGTGTIGKGLLKEILEQNPQVVRIFSRDEYKQFIMEKEFDNKSNIRFLIGDVRDYERVERAMNNIDIVFNLAAMKHVPACEYNPSEAIKTNINGMENVVKAAINNNVEVVVFTSSDKAINPANTYGATKLLAEKLVQSANFSKGNAKTKFVSVRFGNVMGSRGSVIPLFKKQIRDSKKITVTDPEMTRFMMTLSEAVKLIMVAAEKTVGGEIFILKMPVVKLQDLAEVVIEETCSNLGIREDEIDLRTLGLRAGERCFEELMTKDEAEYAYDLENMYAVIPTTYPENFSEFYKNMRKAEKISYNSSEQMAIKKEDVRILLKQEGLV